MTLRAALEAWENRWRERGAPADGWHLPGLAPEVVSTTLRSIHEPHPDLVTWFGWHNGSRHFGVRCLAAPSGRDLTRLEEALDLRQVHLDIEQEWLEAGIPIDATDRYSPLWLPISTTRDAEGYTIAIDLATGEVHRHDNGVGSTIYPQTNMKIGDNLEDVVNVWCSELDRGHYAWRDEAWDYDPLDQPRDLYERNILH